MVHKRSILAFREDDFLAKFGFAGVGFLQDVQGAMQGGKLTSVSITVDRGAPMLPENRQLSLQEFLAVMGIPTSIPILGIRYDPFTRSGVVDVLLGIGPILNPGHTPMIFTTLSEITKYMGEMGSLR